MSRSELVETEARLGQHRTDPGSQSGDQELLGRGESTEARSDTHGNMPETPKKVTHKSTEELPASFQPSAFELEAVAHGEDLSRRVSGSIRPERGNEAVRVSYENTDEGGEVTQVGVRRD